MMVLCPNDHDMATQHVLQETEQRALKATPFNIARGFANGQLSIKQMGSSIDFGGHIFESVAGDLLRINGETLISASVTSEGSLLLGIRLYDEADSLVAEVSENEWISHDPLPWDIEFSKAAYYAPHRRLRAR